MGTVSKHAPVRLDDDLPPWERQPGESLDNYNAFIEYRSLKPSQRLDHGMHTVAQRTDRRTSTITKTSNLYRWADRAAAWDHHVATIHAHADQEQTREAYQRTTTLVDRMSALLEQALHQLDVDELTPTMVIRYADLVMRWRTAVYGQAPTRLEVAGTLDHSLSGNVDVTVQRWADMPPNERDAEIQRLADDVQRKRSLLATEHTDTGT